MINKKLLISMKNQIINKSVIENAKIIDKIIKDKIK